MALPAILLPPDQRHEIMAKALQRYASGETLETVAAEIGVSRESLRSWLLDEVPEQYQHAQKAGLIGQLVADRNEIENASTHLALARARELRRCSQFDAERRLKRLFAPAQEISGPGGGPVVVADAGELARQIAYLLGNAAMQSPQSNTEHNVIDGTAETVQSST